MYKRQTLHATPYNRDATGFYFTDAHDYEVKSTVHVDRYGNLVEEFKIQFIDGDDAQLFEVCGINQANLNIWFDDIEFLQDHEKVNLYYLVGVAVSYTHLDVYKRQEIVSTLKQGKTKI